MQKSLNVLCCSLRLLHLVLPLMATEKGSILFINTLQGFETCE